MSSAQAVHVVSEGDEEDRRGNCERRRHLEGKPDSLFHSQPRFAQVVLTVMLRLTDVNQSGEVSNT